MQELDLTADYIARFYDHPALSVACSLSSLFMASHLITDSIAIAVQIWHPGTSALSFLDLCFSSGDLCILTNLCFHSVRLHLLG
jgi:hypothetical protein